MQIEEEERHQGAAGTSRRHSTVRLCQKYIFNVWEIRVATNERWISHIIRFLKIFKSLPSCKTTANVVFVMSHCTSTFEYPRLKFINAKDQSILVARAKSSKVFVAAWKMDFREFIWQCVLFQPRRCHRTFPARNRLWLIWAGPCHGTSN